MSGHIASPIMKQMKIYGAWLSGGFSLLMLSKVKHDSSSIVNAQISVFSNHSLKACFGKIAYISVYVFF